jgi:3-oxoacyl-[acyl-carrier protein] reductase
MSNLHRQDMSKETEVNDTFNYIEKKFSKLDIVVNSAGISQNRKYNEITMDDWKLTIDNNITNTFLVSVKAVELMKINNYGKIINVSSVAGRNRSKLAGLHYSLSKSAVITLTRQLGAEVAKYGINVNCLAPSQTSTEMLKPFLTEENLKMLSTTIPIGRVAEPKEQAKVILFLASDDAKYMVGSIVDVNGGQI